MDNLLTISIADAINKPMGLRGFSFLLQNSKLMNGILIFSDLIKLLEEHKNWDQLNMFFAKRYEINEEEAPIYESKYGRKIKSSVNINFENIGIQNFFELLDIGSYETTYAVLGNSLPLAIGCSLGIGLGWSKTLEISYNHHENIRNISDWKILWEYILSWTKEYDQMRAKNGIIAYYTKEKRENVFTEDYSNISTNAIDGAKSFMDCFNYLHQNGWPENWELGYLSLYENIYDFIIIKFPPKYNNVLNNTYKGKNGKKCPNTYKSEDWINFIDSLKEGDIIIPSMSWQGWWSIIGCIFTNINLKITKDFSDLDEKNIFI